MHESEDVFRLMVENSADLISKHTPEGETVYVSPACRALLGYEPQELAGRVVCEFLHPADIRKVRSLHKNPNELPDAYRLSFRVCRKDGRFVRLETSARTVRDPDTGAVREIVAVSRDTTERMEEEEAVRENEARFRQMVDSAQEGILLLDAESRTDYTNERMAEMLGCGANEIIGHSVLIFLDEAAHSDAKSHFDRLRQGVKGRSDFQFRRKDGSNFWAMVSTTPMSDDAGNFTGSLSVVTDITERKRFEQQLFYDAFHDALTGLPNRALFLDHLNLALERAKRRADHSFAVLYLDLDRFKVINDSIGHAVGDMLLIKASDRLQNCLRPGDTIARLGGDEFTILLEDIDEAAHAIEVAERIQKEMSLPFNLNGHEAFTTVSIGIALYNASYNHLEELLRDADTAMYQAKSLGKAQHALFDKNMHDQAMHLLQLETDLRRAIDREEFMVLYQPIVSLQTGMLIGFEALVRWRHPKREIICPKDFISLAEETGHIILIGQWVIEEACRQMRQWQENLCSELPLSISVNLSSKQFANSSLIDQIMESLKKTGLDPGMLKLEITESVVMEDMKAAAGMLEQLRSLGVGLSIDDFGTGYSSLSYLHRLPINTLKIDRSFVSRMVESNEHAEIVRTIVMLAKNLGLEVIAEGVETRAQLEQLQGLKCENAQGFLFSRPVDAETAEMLVLKMLQWREWRASAPGLDEYYQRDILEPLTEEPS